MEMDTLRALAPVLAVLAICHGLVDGLIGLLPPNQSPHNEPKLKPSKAVSPKPSQLQNTQLYSPYDHPEKLHNFTVIETELQEDDSCQTLALLRCSSLLLKQSLRNSTNICSDIKHFTSCVLGSLKNFQRREFVTGLVLLDDLRFAVRNTFRCVGNDSSLSHMRHRISKRHGGNCCTEGVMNCAIQTFFKMSTNRRESCHLVSFYDVCMNEISNTCRSDILSTSYPVFVSQMKRQCRGPLKRNKRSQKLKNIFSIKT